MGQARRQAALLCVLAFLAFDFASASLKVEHSFDGSTFLAAGELVGNPLSDAKLSWQRPELSVDALAALDEAVKADRLYSVRVQTPKGELLTSIPARCLREPVLREQAELHADRNGAVVAFTYAIPSCVHALASDGSGGGAAEAAAGRGAVAPALPGQLPVLLVMPTPGPLLTLPELDGVFADVSADAADLGSLGGAGRATPAAGAYDPGAKPRAATGAAPGRKAAPPPDERNWLQKNWLFLVAAGMMALNVATKAMAPPVPPGAPGAGPAGRPALPAGGGGAAGPRRG